MRQLSRRWTLACATSAILLANFALATAAQGQVRFRADEQLDPEQTRQREELLGQDVEVFELDCRNEHFRREVSLFANGTIRVREGTLQAPEMWLGELDRSTTSALIERLQLADVSGVANSSRTVVGEWVETCRYQLDLPGQDRRTFQFERLDSLSLPLQKSLNVAISALGMVDRSVPSESQARLPVGYRPSLGDVLVALDGREFKVSGFANNRTVIEVVGVDQPIVRFHAVADLRLHFTDVTSSPRL